MSYFIVGRDWLRSEKVDNRDLKVSGNASASILFKRDLLKRFERFILMTERLQVLFLYANPKDLSRIRLAEEVREIGYAIEASEFRDHFDLETLHAPRAADVRRGLLKHRPHILHFSGHGSRTRGLYLEDDNGRAKSVTPEALAELIRIIGDNLRLVVLNACYSSEQAAAISRSVDFTIGMQDAIFDPSAIAFSTALYEGLANGRTIYKCFELAKNALSLDGKPGEHIPIIHAERGIDPATTTLVPLETTPPVQAETETSPESDAALHLDLTVMERSTTRVIRKWEYNTEGGHPFFVPVDEGKKKLPLRQAWQELWQLSKAAGKTRIGGNPGLDIFVRLQDNAVETLTYHERLSDLVEEALRNSAGNNLFIAWNQQTFPRLYQKPKMLEDWFSRLIRSGVTDLIEIPTQRQLTVEDVNQILFDRAQQSRRRRDKLRNLVSKEDWNLVLRRPPSAKLSLPRFLDTFQIREGLTFSEGRNLAVFYEEKPRAGWFSLMENARALKLNGNWFIATLSQNNDLDELWNLEGLKSRPLHFEGIIEFNGCFEWLYAFLRLQIAARIAQLTSRNVAARGFF